MTLSSKHLLTEIPAVKTQHICLHIEPQTQTRTHWVPSQARHIRERLQKRTVVCADVSETLSSKIGPPVFAIRRSACPFFSWSIVPTSLCTIRWEYIRYFSFLWNNSFRSFEKGRSSASDWHVCFLIHSRPNCHSFAALYIQSRFRSIPCTAERGTTTAMGRKAPVRPSTAT